MNQPKSKLSVEEKMRLAREAAAAQKEKERLADEAYYTKISTGRSWKVFKIFSYYCLALALIITVETVIDGKEKHITPANYKFYEGAIVIDDDVYLPYYEELFGFLDTSFYVVNSPIFGTPKYLKWVSKYEDTKTPLKFTDYTVYKESSLFSYFIFIQIVLLIPIFFVFYKRPSPLFKFGRMLCLILVFPASIYLFFVTIGAFELLIL